MSFCWASLLNGHPEKGLQTAVRNVDVRLVSWGGDGLQDVREKEGSPGWSGHQPDCLLPVPGAANICHCQWKLHSNVKSVEGLSKFFIRGLYTTQKLPSQTEQNWRIVSYWGPRKIILVSWQYPFLIIIARVHWLLSRNSHSIKFCTSLNSPTVTLCINSPISQTRSLRYRELKERVRPRSYSE